MCSKEEPSFSGLGSEAGREGPGLLLLAFIVPEPQTANSREPIRSAPGVSESSRTAAHNDTHNGCRSLR